MTDELDTAIEEPKTEDVVKPERIFKQAEVDKMIAERVRREKEQAKKLVEEHSSEKLSLETTIKSYEEQIEKFLSPQLEDIPDEFKPLISKLTVLEKIEWLASRNKTAKRTIPSTPKRSEVEQKPNPQNKTRRFI